jgi:hypothetical protein
MLRLRAGFCYVCAISINQVIKSLNKCILWESKIIDFMTNLCLIKFNTTLNNWDKEKWPSKTSDILQEVQFIRNFL